VDGKKKDWKLHNTKILLKHYRDLKDRCNRGVYDSRMLDQRTRFEQIEDLMQGRDDDLILDSTYRSILRTRTMVADVEAMMKAYKADAQRGSDTDKRRVQVIFWVYIAKKRMDTGQLAEKFGVTRRQIQKDLREAEAHLSAKYFGVDGLHFFANSLAEKS
jgi:hypothetical protein